MLVGLRAIGVAHRARRLRRRPRRARAPQAAPRRRAQDRPLVRLGVAHDPRDAAIVHSRGPGAPARRARRGRGRRDPRRWELLPDCACDEAQGHFLARPMGGETLAAWLHAIGLNTESYARPTLARRVYQSGTVLIRARTEPSRRAGPRQASAGRADSGPRGRIRAGRRFPGPHPLDRVALGSAQ